jgi:hypothetical protein
MPDAVNDDNVVRQQPANETDSPGGPTTKRVNFNLPKSAVAAAENAARVRGWNLTHFFLFALGLAVRVLDETSKGGRVKIEYASGEVKELVIPQW